MSNLDLALKVARELAASGVEEVCLCAGARNSPLVVALSEIGAFRKFHYFEERSAGFFALGRMKSHGKPVAVVTTSGTAAAELLPAMIEAHYTGLPLLAVTADRPRAYRGSGAPQAIEQLGIYGTYASAAVDLAAGESHGFENWSRRGPAHFNVCFEEPLLDRCFSASEFEAPAVRAASALPASSGVLDDFLSSCKNPLVIVSGLNRDAQAAVESFLMDLGALVYLEATSGLRESSRLRDLAIQSTDRVLSHGAFDAVLRIGGVPTLRFWRDLEEKLAHLPLLSISDVPFSGCSRAGVVQASLPEFFSDYRVSRRIEGRLHERLLTADRKLAQGLAELFEREPHSEPAMVRALSRVMSAGSRVYLGNSMPIREWDLAATREDRRFELAANRGANGIDGQVSSFYGFAHAGSENWGLIGDLTALYDLSAPWILPQLGALETRLAVINNGGGKIFSRMFENPVFQNQHQIELMGWAQLWKLNYHQWHSVPALPALSGHCLIELRPDAEATDRFWKAYDLLCKSV